mmetsp:Transcript_78358/g.181791  ORF Transcript_78358/g.181791 Transcript_78358/m.181791 type:complete len:232 (-) Transcript_78358:1876-2571(-)
MGLKTASGRMGVPSASVSGGLLRRPGRTPVMGKCAGLPLGMRRRSRAATSATRRSRPWQKSVRTCRYLGLAVGLPSTRRKWLELTTYFSGGPAAAPRRHRCMGSVNSSKATAFLTRRSAWAPVSGSKLDMKVPSCAMSSSHLVSQPRMMASSGRWKSLSSQFRTIFKEGLVISALRCSSAGLGSTMEALMSSSVWILAAGTKSKRSWNFRSFLSAVRPTRRYCATTCLPST